MTSSRKGAFSTLTAVIVICGLCWAAFAVKQHKKRVAEAKKKEAERRLAWNNQNVSQLMALGSTTHFQEEEQLQIDHAGSDTGQLQQVLLSINRARFELWNKRYKEQMAQLMAELGISQPGASATFTKEQLQPYADEVHNVENAHDEADLYRLACKKIEDWRPSDINTFTQASGEPVPTSAPARAAEQVPQTISAPPPVNQQETTVEPIAYNVLYGKMRSGSISLGQRYAFAAGISEYNGALFLRNPDFPRGPEMLLNAEARFDDRAEYEALLSSGADHVRVVASPNSDGTVNIYSAH